MAGAGPRVRFPAATGAHAVDIADVGSSSISSISSYNSSGGGSGGGQPSSSLPLEPSQLIAMRRRLSNSGSFSGKVPGDEAPDTAEERPRAMSAAPGEDKYGLLYTDCAHVLLAD